MSDSERVKVEYEGTDRFIDAYFNSLKQQHTEAKIISLVKKYVQLHSTTQWAELVFLLLGIVYFIEAIVKNTMEMLHSSGVN